MGTSGYVAPGFGRVAEEFRRKFTERGDLGAAFAVIRDDEPLVDLWGGIADRAGRRPWTADTLQILFSGTKGLVAACILMLIERGQLVLDTPVARYWPEFAAAGKAEVLVRNVVSHTVALPGLEVPVTWREATDARRMAALGARQPRSSDPRASRTYHAVTFGWLCGELIHRVDGRCVGQFFAEEIADPLNLDIWIGLPQDLEPRVSAVELAPAWAGSPDGAVITDPLRRAVENPPRYQPASFPWNEPGLARRRSPQLQRHRHPAFGRTVLRRPRQAAVASDPSARQHGPQQPLRPAAGPPDLVRRRFPAANRQIHPRSCPGCVRPWGGGRVGPRPLATAAARFLYAMNLLRNDPGDQRAARSSVPCMTASNERSRHEPLPGQPGNPGATADAGT